jgi:hypothetical protein
VGAAGVSGSAHRAIVARREGAMDRTVITGTTIFDGSGVQPLLLVDGNPLEDIKLLQDRDALLVIMKDGHLYKQPAA